MFRDFYRNKKVLVTGHTGFKGSWISIWLNMLGAKVYGYSLSPVYYPNNYNTSNISKLVNEAIADITNYESFRNFILKSSPEIVFHLAAQPLVRVSYKETKKTYETNLMGLVNLLEILNCTNSVKTIIVITSDKCYENLETEKGYRENDKLGGHDPYSASKACAEIISKSYFKSFFRQKGIGLATVRAGNVIGGGDWSTDRLIPDCIRSLSNNEKIIIRNPNATRPWQHVLEPLSGYLLLGTKLYNKYKKYSESWNFGPEIKSIANVFEISNAINKLWTDKNFVQVQEDKKNLYESKLLHLNINKAKTELKWKPVLNLKQALTLTVAWYLEYYNKKNSLTTCRNQIYNYVDIARRKKLNWII